MFFILLVGCILPVSAAVGDTISYNGVRYCVTKENMQTDSFEVQAVRYEAMRIVLPDSVPFGSIAYCVTSVPYWYDSITCALSHYSIIDMSRCLHVTKLIYQYSRMIDIDTLVLPPYLNTFPNKGFYSVENTNGTNPAIDIDKLQRGIHRIISTGQLKNARPISIYECGALQEVDLSSYTNIDQIYIGTCHFLKKIVVPNTLKTLALYYDVRLTDFNMPDSLESFAATALPVAHIHLGANVRFFNPQSAMDWQYLDSISVDPLNPWLCAVDGVVFTRDTTILLKYPYSKKGDIYMLPPATTQILSFAFHYSWNSEDFYSHFRQQIQNSELRQIVLNNRIWMINNGPALRTDIESDSIAHGNVGDTFGTKEACHITDIVNFENTKICEIRHSPFRNTYIRTLAMPSTLRILGATALAEMQDIVSIDFSRAENLQKIKTHAFADCPKLQTLDLFHCALVTDIISGTFMNDLSLTDVLLPRNVESIGDSAFFGCAALSRLVCPAITPIGISKKMHCFDEVNTNACELVVPSRSIPLYQQAPVWQDFNITSNGLYTIDILASDSLGGIVSGTGVYLAGDTVTVCATALDGYEFVGWNDGNTDNPRTITATQDTTYTAVFQLLSGLSQPESQTTDSRSTRKVLRDSKVYIEHGDDTFTVLGVPEK